MVIRLLPKVGSGLYLDWWAKNSQFGVSLSVLGRPAIGLQTLRLGWRNSRPAFIGTLLSAPKHYPHTVLKLILSAVNVSRNEFLNS